MLNDMSSNTAAGGGPRRKRGGRNARHGPAADAKPTRRKGKGGRDDADVPPGEQHGGDDANGVNVDTDVTTSSDQTAAPPPTPPPQAEAEQPTDAAAAADDTSTAADAAPAAPPADFNPLRHPVLFDTPYLLSID